MSKRILFWSERFWPTIGGVGLNAARLLPALQARGYDFVVVTLLENADLPEEDDYDGIRVCRWPFWTALQGGDILELVAMRQRVASLKRDFAADLVHINFLGPTVLFHAQTASIHPAPVLVSMDSAFAGERSGEDSLARKVLSSADWVTAVSKDRLAQIRDSIPGLESRSSCIYRGTRAPEVEPTPPPDGPPHILCIGRLERVKGFDLAIASFVRIVERFPDARMTIAGDGPERTALEHQVSEAGLKGAVRLIGWVDPDDVRGLMQTSTLVLIPSRDEGIPAVAREAGLACRPVVAATVGGLPEVVVAGRTGILIEPEDPDALARAAVRLLENPALVAELGRNARTHISETFSFARYVAAYDTLYRKLTASN